MSALEQFSKLPWKSDLMTRREKWEHKQEQARKLDLFCKGIAIGIPIIFCVSLSIAVFIFDVDILQVLKANFIPILKFIMSIFCIAGMALMIALAGCAFIAPYGGLVTKLYKTKDEAIKDGIIALTTATIALAGAIFVGSKWLDLLGK